VGCGPQSGRGPFRSPQRKALVVVEGGDNPLLLTEALYGPNQPRARMSAEENKALARRFMDEVYNEGNVNFIDEVVASNLVVHDPTSPEGMTSGVQSAKQFVEVYRNAFPDIQMTVEDLIAEGDKVVTRWRARGTHQGELMGIPPSGNPVEVTGITIDRIEGGKVVETWANYDALGMMQQVGAVPEPGQAQGA
jgi:steroid delta-isomerase-like uncharacterized protein